MGKSSKRKKLQSETAAASQGAVYAKTMDLTKEEISFLKNQLQQQMSQGYARIKSKNKNSQKSTSAAQGIEVYQTGGPPPFLHSLGIASQNQIDRGSIIGMQHDAIQAAQLYMQKQPRVRKIKKVARKKTGDIREQAESTQGYSHIQEEENYSKQNSSDDGEQSDQSNNEAPPRDLSELQGMRNSLHSRISQQNMIAERKAQKQLILAENTQYSQQEQYEYSSSAQAHYENISTLQPRTTKVASIGKKASAPQSIRKPSQAQMPTVYSQGHNIMNQTMISSKQMLQSLPPVEKSLHQALNVYAKKSIDHGLQHISASNKGALTRVQPQHLEQFSPREVTKSSLLIQKTTTQSRGGMNNRIELNSQILDPRTATVVKHINQASKQNLMIVQNDSQLSNHPNVEKLTPALINQLQMQVSPLNGNTNQRIVMALSPKRLTQVNQQQRHTPYSRRLLQQQQQTHNSNFPGQFQHYHQPYQQFQSQDSYQPAQKSYNMPQIQHHRDQSQGSLHKHENMMQSSRTHDSIKQKSTKKRRIAGISDGSSSSSSCSDRSFNSQDQSIAGLQELVSPDFRAQTEESIVEVNEMLHINGGTRVIEEENNAGQGGTHRSLIYKSPVRENPMRPESEMTGGQVVEDNENIVPTQNAVATVTSLSNQKELSNTQSRLGLGYKPRRVKPVVPPIMEEKISKPGESIVCQIVSIEPYMKRCMQKLGWVLSSSNGNQFNLKYDIADKEGTINKLHNKQWYNHFPNNRELTTKAGLCKNLWHYCLLDYELKIQNFFPRCYDLSDQKNIEQFALDFQMTAILSIIKQYTEHFMRTTSMISEYFQDYLKKDQYQKNHVFKQHFKFKCANYDQLRSCKGNLLGNDNLRLAQEYIRVNVLKKQHIDSQNKIYKKFSEEEINLLVEFSQQLWETGIQNQQFPIYEQIKILALNRKLCKLYPQYSVIDGLANVWVVKPSYNARGVGVYCTNKIKDIFQQGKKSTSKIVQKYIERPFLLNQKKFDIRQWVLVTSWEPLDIYVFSSAYLKICGNEFNLRNLGDQYSHLSNFSIQKGNKQFGNDDLVMSHDQFEAYVRNNVEGKSGYSWEADMRPQIHQVVYASLKAAQDAMEQRACTFEVYGFDLILDESLRPWVIEVNLSPACNERTEWLTKMVDDMCLDLLAHVEQRILMQADADADNADGKEKPKRVPNLPLPLSLSLNKENFYSDHDIKHRWVRLDECLIDFKNTKLTDQAQLQIPQNQKISPSFELVGTKMNTKLERVLDKDYRRNKSIAMIQRCYRGYKDRLIYKRLIQEKSSLFIQRYLRKNLASKKVLSIKQSLASFLIQRYLRVILAKNLVKQMIQQRILQAKTFVALKLQSHFRRHQAQKLLKILKEHHSATIIQSYMRRLIKTREIRQRLSYKAKIVRIQRFFKKFLRKKKQKAIYIQKCLRVVRAKRKVTKMLKISKGSQKLLGMIFKAKMRQFLRKLRINARIYIVQKYLRAKLAFNKVARLKQEKAQTAFKNLITKFIFRSLHQTAKDTNHILNKKASFIQNLLKSYMAKQKVRQLRLEQQKNTVAILIQSYMRRYLAKKMVSERAFVFKSLIKIQSFARMIIAKRFVREKFKELKQIKKTKKLKKQNSRKFSGRKGSSHNKEIENYIESILIKEVNANKERLSTRQSERNTKSNIMTTSQTPINQGAGQPPFPKRGSFKDMTTAKEKDYNQAEILSAHINQTSLQPGKFNLEQDLSEVSKQAKYTPVTEKNFFPNDEYVSGTIQSQYNKDGTMAVSISDDLALQRLGDELSINADRLQKHLRIRKNQAQKSHIAQLTQPDGTVKHPNQIMSNYSEIRHGKSAGNAYQKELNSNVVQVIQKNKQKNAPPQISTIKKPKQPKVSNTNEQLPKAKSFAENLMNMLAKQNIGHVFSENPVEALSILKDNSKPNMSNNRRQSQHTNQRNELNNINIGNNQQITTVPDIGVNLTSKFTQFPKLSDFKSATNNIYLQNRPIADPRQESEFQQAVQEMRNKQQSFQNLATHSRADNKLMDISQRKSVENLKTVQLDRLGKQVNPSPPSFQQNQFEDSLLQRPSAGANNQMIIHAYKKAQLFGSVMEQQLQHPPKIHITAQSLGAGKPKKPKNEIKQLKSKFSKGPGEYEEGIMIPLNSKKGNLSNYTSGQSDGKNQQSMPSIYADTHTKLMII